MNLKSLGNFLIIPLVLLITVACSSENRQSEEVQTKVVNTVLNEWHLAASEADFDRYFEFFASDSAIFMGTDATERWNISEFKVYAKPHFESGNAWTFTPVERHVNFAANGQTAWFDESLDTPNLGPARGSGVLVRQNGDWKIAHYNLSIPIPNSIADTVVKQVEGALSDTAAEN